MDNHNGMVTHLEPDILECEVKWALGSMTMNKASEGDGTLAELFQILKDDTLSVTLNSQQVWNTKQWTQDWKRSISSQFQRREVLKECSNDWRIVLISHASTVMLKILHARLQ